MPRRIKRHARYAIEREDNMEFLGRWKEAGRNNRFETQPAGNAA
jgi:hypothetical protein